MGSSNSHLHDQMFADRDEMFAEMKTRIDEQCTRSNVTCKEMMGKMAETEAKFEKAYKERKNDLERANHERKNIQERAAERYRVQYELRMDEKDKHHKIMMEQKEEHVKDLKEQNKMVMQMFKEMHADTMSHQTKQIEALSKGMESITDSVNKMQLMLTGQTPPPKGDKSNIPDQGLKKICVVMLDNIGALSNIREYVSRDQETLEQLFRAVGSDIKQIRRGENLATASTTYGREDYTEYDMVFVVAFSSGSNVTLINGSQSFEIDQLCEPFRLNSTLTGKPKIFLIHVISDDTPFLVGAESARGGLLPTEDVLICHYELTEELYKRTSTEIGSFFVKSLGYVFQLYSRTNDVVEILEKLRDEVTAEQQEEISFGLVNGLKTKVYFPQV